MPWKVNPKIQGAIDQFLPTQAAEPKSGQEGYWDQFYKDLSSPETALNAGGLNSGAIIRAGQAGRSVSEGSTIDPQLAAAGGGDQWALNNAAKNAGRVGVAGQFGSDVAKGSAAAGEEMARYQQTRGRQTDQFNLGKYGAAAKALSGGSTYQVSPWFGVLQGLIGGAASNLKFGGGSDEPSGGDYADSPMMGYGDPPWAGGGTGTYG